MVTLVVPADHTIIQCRPVPCLHNIHVWSHMWYRPITPSYNVGRYYVCITYICGHTCGTGRLYYNSMVGRYYVYVAYMWLHIWYRPIALLYHGRPVPCLHSIYGITHTVSADCTIIPW